jgi:hypothetical protein
MHLQLVFLQILQCYSSVCAHLLRLISSLNILKLKICIAMSHLDHA